MSRKSLIAIVLSTLILVAAAACSLERSKSSAEGNLTIPNSLGLGSTSDGGILVQFVGVEDDSRCAAGVECVRAGEAFVVLRSTINGDGRFTSRLEMAPGGEASSTFEEYTITVLELRPDPPPVGGVQQSEYEILLRIEEN